MRIERRKKNWEAVGEGSIALLCARIVWLIITPGLASERMLQTFASDSAVRLIDILEKKNSKKLDNKSEKKSVFTVNSHYSLILNSFTFYFKFFLPNS